MYRVMILVLLFALLARFAYWFGVSNKDNNWIVGIMCPVALTISNIAIFHINKYIEKKFNK